MEDPELGPAEPPEAQARKSPDVERVYRNEQIAVYWEPKLCIHAGECYRNLPGVFKPNERPWVDVNRAGPEAITEVVIRCPTGALHFERLDGGPQEPEPDVTTVRARRNGPLFVRGRVRIVGENGQVIRDDTRLALCRCGASQNKPFCDLSHRKIRFNSAR